MALSHSGNHHSCIRLAVISKSVVLWIPVGPPTALQFAALGSEERSLLHALPTTLDIDEGILAVHGRPMVTITNPWPRNSIQINLCRAAARYLQNVSGLPTRRIFLRGHGQRQSVTQTPGGYPIVNSGTVGCPVFADLPTASQSEPRTPHAWVSALARGAGDAKAQRGSEHGRCASRTLWAAHRSVAQRGSHQDCSRRRMGVIQ